MGWETIHNPPADPENLLRCDAREGPHSIGREFC